MTAGLRELHPQQLRRVQRPRRALHLDPAGMALVRLTSQPAAGMPEWTLQDSSQRKISMYAVLRLNSFDAEKLTKFRSRVEEFDRIHAGQPGYAGSLLIDLGSGRRFALNLCTGIFSSGPSCSSIRTE